ncbi:hypothetical protein HAZT_HAZT010809 [Hyalella azteca]|nr:hypothetical protein HAZT_HAZT010809 [Hyalella azteca]
MPTDHVIASFCYLLSGFLDAFDGHAARAFNQSTKFGGMLDMLTDRCGTMCLIACLGTFYPKYLFWFQLSITIDIACHWLHLHTSLLEGRTSHKSSAANPNFILQIYYTSRPVLFLMCSGNELFYASLYLVNFTEGPSVFFGVGLWRLLSYVLLPVGVFKSILALMQGYYAALNLGNIDMQERAKATN